MIGDVVGRRYGQALFNLARRENALDAVRETLDVLVHLMETSRTFRYFMLTPRIDDRKKVGLLQKIFEKHAPEIFFHFLVVIFEKRRQEYLGKIRDHIETLNNQSIGRIIVKASSARMLAPEEQKELVAALEERTGRQVVLSNTVDPSLIGGVLLRMGYKILDATVKGRLRRIRANLIEQM